MKSVATAHLQLEGMLPGEITFTRRKIGLAEALDLIVATRNRRSREAYVFLRDSLDYTTRQQKKTKGAAGDDVEQRRSVQINCTE